MRELHVYIMNNSGNWYNLGFARGICIQFDEMTLGVEFNNY